MTRMSIEPHGPAQRYGTITVENDRERSAADARQIAIKKHPDVDRVVITGRNGMLLYEEYVQRGDSVWVEKNPAAAKPKTSVHHVISYLIRRVFR